MADHDDNGALTPDLREDLLGFLALEAPFLRSAVPVEADDAVELEKTLLTALERRLATGAGDKKTELFPNLTRAEAVSWTTSDLAEQIRGFFARRAIRESLSDDERVEMLRAMLLTRAVDNQLKKAFDEKQIRWREYPSPQKGFRSTGQEAIVGAALRLRRGEAYGAGGDAYSGDIVSPLIRDLGVLLMFMPDPVHPLLVQYGKDGTPVGGRDLHTGDLRHGVLPPAAPLATAAQTMVGIGYAFKRAGEDRVGVTLIGDGGSSLGEWHEAVNFAAVQKLNLVFIIENNQWALGTHVSEQSAARRFAAKAGGYGIPGVTLFGNDPEEIAAGVSWAAERAREGHGPALIELVTYRRSGHAHHDDDRFHGHPQAGLQGYEYVDESELWAAWDPVDRYYRRLVDDGVLSQSGLLKIEAQVEDALRSAVERAEAAPWPQPGEYRRRVHVSAEACPREVTNSPATANTTATTKRMSYDEAVRQALIEAMDVDPSVFVLGEDVGGRYGGAFGVTRGLAKRFGPERCLNTPLAESAIVGCGVGAGLMGLRPVVEIQFADFLAPAFNALVNNAAKLYWRWGGKAPLVVRLPYGGATGTMEKLLGGGPYHSQCPEMWFVRTPGWKIVAPATPADAKGLMLAAIQDDGPVLFMESKGLYGFFRTDLREEVPLGAEASRSDRSRRDPA